MEEIRKLKEERDQILFDMNYEDEEAIALSWENYHSIIEKIAKLKREKDIEPKPQTTDYLANSSWFQSVRSSY